MTTTDKLAAIQARVDAATEGPWVHEGFDSGHSRFEMNHYIVTPDTGDSICDMDGLSRSNNERHATDDGAADAEFIAHARTDVPALLALIREQASKLEAVRKLHSGNQWGCCRACSEHVDVPMPCPTRTALTATEAPK